MTDPPVIADVALLVARRFGVTARRRQPGRLPRDRGRAEASRQPLVVGRFAVPIRLLPPARRPRRRDRRDDAPPARREGRDAERVRVIPNWVDTAR